MYGGHRQVAPEIQNPEVARWLGRAVSQVHFQQLARIFEKTSGHDEWSLKLSPIARRTRIRESISVARIWIVVSTVLVLVINV